MTTPADSFQVIAGITGGCTPFKYSPTGAANQDSTVVKPSLGNIYSIQIANIGSTAAWLKFYDQTTAPTSANTPVKVLPIPANSTPANMAGLILGYASPGLSFLNGIAFRVCTGIADSDVTAVSSNNIIINLDIK